MTTGFHQPVLLQQAVNHLLTDPAGVYVDCTLGGGGHGQAFLSACQDSAFLIGIDADPEALATAANRLANYSNTLLRHAYSDQLSIIVYESGRYPVDGVFYDLGVSSHQIDESARGFTFRGDAPLDMRMDTEAAFSAIEVVNGYSQEELEQVIRNYGEERHWRAIARDIVRRRAVRPLQTAADLAEVVQGIVGDRHLNKSLARVFQAIRIEVNQELKRLETSLDEALSLLKEGGRLVVISYHSLEDRIVKDFMRNKQSDCVCPPELPTCVCDKVQELKMLTRRPVVPEEAEIRQNPRARSAKLRAAEKVVPFTGI